VTNEFSLEALIKKIYSRKKQSVWTITKGKKQSGKTNFILRQMEILHELGLADGFGSNIKTLEAPFKVDFIDNFQTLQERCQMLNPNPEKHGIKRFFYLCSEMGKAFPQDQPWLNVKFIADLQLVRKIGLNWLGDGINRIDERIVNEIHFDGEFTKVSITRPDIATYKNLSNKRTVTIYGIKPTTLKYNTWESCNFYMEPHIENTEEIPLNSDHLIVKKYLECDCSIAKTGLHANAVKRARDNVLKYYWKYHLQPTTDDNNTVAEPSSIEES
jgi:hypothetical protein